MLLSGCPAAPDGPRFAGAGSEEPRSGGILTFQVESNVRTLDPHLAFDESSNIGIRLLFEGLLDYDYESNLIPGLAETMPERFDDGKRYRFRLRRGVRFHNGRELTSEDVRWSLERMLHPDVGSPGYTFFSNIDGLEEYRAKTTNHIRGIRPLDRYSIEFVLKAADQTFLNAMAMTFAYPVPRENYARTDRDVGFHPIGTGPFRLVSWERGVRLLFERHRQYYKKGMPYLDGVEYLENINRDIAAMRFRNGEIDHVRAVSLADYVFFRDAPKWKPYALERPSPDIWGLVMNCELAPFNNVHVRRAVSFALNRQRWSRSRGGRLRVTGQPIPPGILGYNEHLAERQVYDLARAREEMRLAGFPNGINEEVTMWSSDGPAGRYYGELAQEDLRKIGIKIRIKQVAFAIYLQETGKPRTAQMLLSGWVQDFPDPADFLDILFHSRAIHPHDSENRSFYRNRELDQLLDVARAEPDREKRRLMYERASAIVTRDAPWAFMWNSLQFEAWQPYLRGYRRHPVWTANYRNAWLDLPRRRIAWRNLGAPFVRYAHGSVPSDRSVVRFR